MAGKLAVPGFVGGTDDDLMVASTLSEVNKSLGTGSSDTVAAFSAPTTSGIVSDATKTTEGSIADLEKLRASGDLDKITSDPEAVKEMLSDTGIHDKLTSAFPTLDVDGLSPEFNADLLKDFDFDVPFDFEAAMDADAAKDLIANMKDLMPDVDFSSLEVDSSIFDSFKNTAFVEALRSGSSALGQGILGLVPNDLSFLDVGKILTLWPGMTSDYSLEVLIAMADRFGGDFILSKFPDVVPMILKFYPMGFPSHAGMEVTACHAHLMSILSKFDDEWYLTDRGSSMIYDLNPYGEASNEALAILASAEPTRASAYIASAYPIESPSSLLKGIQDLF